MYENRTLVRGDNLEEMRRFPDDSIDLIATDPPFNSKRNYFVPYRDQHGQEPDTLIRAFTDTWTWGEAAEDAYQHLLVEEGGQIGNTIQGLRQFLNETPMMAYLVVKYPRLKSGLVGDVSSNKPVVATDFSFHRGWYPIPLHEGRKPPYVRYSKPRCGRGRVSNHRIYNGTDVQTTSV